MGSVRDNLRMIRWTAMGKNSEVSFWLLLTCSHVHMDTTV